ncbi:MAG: rhodanese-like domain-containing protein, partial [Gammaproteobacteria bacterium]
PHAPLVVMCHGGMRSLQVAQYLTDQGFADVYNLSGGIDAWSQEVDPAVPRY